ncbi:methyltransferase family protein [Cryptosporangium sp. NPDC051539]|uniref:methyltransferase family protein n=1 Tax=Cryptosporangium sp. NPDC051539 TaxID=3363962 RepID=UPI0037B239DF
MRKRYAAAGSALFFALAPGTVAGLVPYALTTWHPGPTATALRAVGAVLTAAAAAVLLHAFTRFVREGFGTPAPAAPTAHLVVGGLYRYVRNPMYLAVDAAIVGQALLLGRPVLYVYAAVIAATTAAFVHGYEEPTLREQFGAEYDAYRRSVPAWLPRPRCGNP